MTLNRYDREFFRREVLETAGGDAENATRLLINRVLHAPSETLRRALAERPAQAQELEFALRALFRLPVSDEAVPDEAAPVDVAGGDTAGGNTAGGDTADDGRRSPAAGQSVSGKKQ